MSEDDSESQDESEEDGEETMVELYDIVANDASGWLRKVSALFSSGAVLFDLYKTVRPDNNAPSHEREHSFHMLCIVKMLRGMGMESLLKTVWVAKGNAMGKDGKFKYSLKAKSHDLYDIAKVVCAATSIPLTDDEGHMLARLAFTIEMGRYPVRTSFDKYPSTPKTQPPCFYRREKEDETLFHSFVSKLMNKLEEGAEPAS